MHGIALPLFGNAKEWIANAWYLHAVWMQEFFVAYRLYRAVIAGAVSVLFRVAHTVWCGGRLPQGLMLRRCGAFFSVQIGVKKNDKMEKVANARWKVKFRVKPFSISAGKKSGHA